MATALMLFSVSLKGIWLFPPWWTPYLYGMLFIVAVIFGLRRRKSIATLPRSYFGWIAIVLFGVIGIYSANESD
jgi:hypothetical protein